MQIDVGSVVGGRYRVTGALGRGGMGAVFLAVQEPLGREVALKVLSPELASDAAARERFLREARAVSRLNHPHVVTVHDFGTDDDGTLYLVMERARGRPLRAILDERGALDPALALALLTDVCKGVAAAHQAGIVHGDLKPENILVALDDEKSVKVLDFGLARLMQSDEATVTRAGQILGTPRYLSPEQVKGVRDNPSSDLYAMGVMLFEMLTGRPPFDESSVAMLIVAHMTSAPPRPSSCVGHGLPEDLDGVTARLLEKDPAVRGKDATALLPLLVEKSARLAATQTLPEGMAAPRLSSGAPAPEGDVVLVFTDIESSSALWERVPALMREGLKLHDEIMRRAIDETGGYEVKTQGDSFMIAFARIEDAARFSTTIQTRLMEAPWADALLAEREAAPVTRDERLVFRGLRVRVGFFAGTPDCRRDPVSQRMDYFGPVVNRAARVESAAHGGQVFYGHEEHARRGFSVDGVTLRALGPVKLKGIDAPIHLVELVPDALAGRSFAPPRTVDEKAPTNLPPERTSLVGRDALVDDVVRRLEGDVRTVTLIGAAGVGKSRVALRAARVLVEKNARPGGVLHVALADVTSALDVVAATARALSVTLLSADSEERAIAQLRDVLATRAPTLLVMDDVDRCRAALARVVEGITRDTRASLLMTGRAPVRARGEVVIEVPPLSDDDAAALFAARVVEQGGTVGDADRGDIATLVRALDGLPLALELAAGRARVMKPRQLVERLSRRFDLLKTSGGDDARRATLRGALDLSWETLDDLERAALAQCSIFEGAFSLDAAERVLDLSAVDDMAFIIDVLDGLREKSLLRALHSDALGEVRFVISESVRAYASERRAAHTDEASLTLRYTQYTVEHAEQLAALVHTPRFQEALAGLAADTPHLRAAIAQSADALAIRAGLALATLLAARGPVAAHRAVVDEAMRRAEALADATLLMRALNVRGRFESVWGNPTHAVVDLERASTIAESVGDDLSRAFSLQALVRAHVRLLDVEKAHAAMALVRPLLPRLGHARLSALVENEGMLFTFARTLDEARMAFERAHAHVREAGDRELEARILSNFGIIHSLRGFPEEAYPHLEEALRIAREVGARPLEGLVLGNMGGALVILGRHDDAVRVLRQAVEIHVETGNRLLHAADGGGLGLALFMSGDDTEALVELERAAARAAELDARRERGQALMWKLVVHLARRELSEAGVVKERFAAMAPALVHIGFESVYEGLSALYDAVAAEGSPDVESARAHAEDVAKKLGQVGGPATMLVSRAIEHVVQRRRAAAPA